MLVATHGSDLATVDLAQAINEAHRNARLAACNAVEHAAECGRLLAEAKAAVGHGGWLKWLVDHFDGSERTASAYMRAAKHWPAIEANRQTTADLTLDAALKLIAAPGKAGDTEAPDVSPDGSNVSGDVPRFDNPPRNTERDEQTDDSPSYTEPEAGPEAPDIQADDDEWLGNEDDPLAAGLADGKQFDALIRQITSVYPEAKKLAEGYGGAFLDDHKLSELRAKLQNAAQVLRDTRPHCECPYCKGNGVGCRQCRSSGILPKMLAADAPIESHAAALPQAEELKLIEIE